MIRIYTDGSSRGNPGPGGWAAVIQVKDDRTSDEKIFEIGGREEMTTNNRMELTAAIKALEFVRGFKNGGIREVGHLIIIFSDSEYMIKGITLWISGWKNKNWIGSAKKPVLNKDLWVQLDQMNMDIRPEWRYVEGHSGNKGNERCDEIATSFADGKDILLRCDL